MDETHRRLRKALTRLHELAKGGPYIGPRGGLWADPEHTVHWEPHEPKAAPAVEPIAIEWRKVGGFVGPYNPVTGHRLYFRIQPIGLGIDHLSEGSAGDRDYLHAFEAPWQVFTHEGGLTRENLNGFHYLLGEEDLNSEIVVIDSPESYDNMDAEGVGLDPDECHLVGRFTAEDFARAFLPGWTEGKVSDEDMPEPGVVHVRPSAPR